jgi:hypothetical protein
MDVAYQIWNKQNVTIGISFDHTMMKEFLLGRNRKN